MGEGSEARGGNDCCSIVWLVKVLADSHLSWFIPPWLPDQGEGEGIVWLPDQGGEQGTVWLPDPEGKQGIVWLPDKQEESKGIWLPDHWGRGKFWLPDFLPTSLSSLSTRRVFFSSLGGGNVVLGHMINWSVPLWKRRFSFRK